MLVRTLLSIVNLGVIAVAVTIAFVFTQYAGLAVYALLGWMLVTFVMMYSAWGNRPVSASSGGTRASGTAPAPGNPFAPASPPPAPRPGTAASPAGPARGPAGPAPTPPIDFCVYCAASLPAGVPRCPSCGHAVVPL